jgi:hypothetical protein
VCVESKTAECTKKDPCKILAICAKFISSRIVYSRVFRHIIQSSMERFMNSTGQHSSRRFEGHSDIVENLNYKELPAELSA